MRDRGTFLRMFFVYFSYWLFLWPVPMTLYTHVSGCVHVRVYVCTRVCVYTCVCVCVCVYTWGDSNELTGSSQWDLFIFKRGEEWTWKAWIIAYRNVCTHTHSHARTHASTHVHRQTYTRVRARQVVHTRAPLLSLLSAAEVSTNTRIHTHIHTHTHTHTEQTS